MRRLLLRSALSACLAVLAAAPAGASAATYVLRPDSTYATNAAWRVTPAGTSLDAALSDPAVAPTAPGTSIYATVTGSASAASLGLSAPTLATGETPSSATLWVYSDVGTGESLQPGLFYGWFWLGGGFVPASGPGWHSFALPRAPSASQLGHLSLTLGASGQSYTSAKVYAAYLELNTTPPATQSAGSTPSLPDATVPAATPSLPGAPALTPASLPAAPPVQIAAPPVAPAPNASTVAVGLACPRSADATLCRGVVTLRVLAILGRPHARRIPRTVPRNGRGHGRGRVSNRCARGCRAIVTETHFALRRGRRGRIRLRLAKTVRQALRTGHSVRARLSVTTTVPHGTSTTTSRIITLRPR